MPRVIQWRRAHPLTAFTLVSWALAVLFPYVAPGLTSIPLVCALAGSAVLITRRAADEPVLTRMVVGSFCIRGVLTVSLFLISWLDLPILGSLHREFGAWEFGGDGAGYHKQALRILDAWREGTDLPSVFMIGNYHHNLYKDLSLPMAMVYGVLGTSPLHFMLVNAWLGAMSGLVAYLLASRLGDRRSALVAAGLVAFWPSSILWSTQLLKDPLLLALALSALLLLVALWQRYSSTEVGHGRRAAAIGRWAALAAAVFGVTYFRSYLGVLLTVSVALVLGAAAGRALLRGRRKEAIAALGITVLVGASTLAAMSVDFMVLLSPRNPEIGHVRRGHTLEQQGQLGPAVEDYRRAIDLNPTYSPAYRALGETLIAQGDREGAIEALNSYLSLETDETQRQAVADLIASRVAPDARVSTAKAPAAPAIQSAPGVAGRVSALLARLNEAVQGPLSWLSVKTLGQLRRAQIAAGGASVMGATIEFNTLWDVVAYVPRAIAVAYLAPFPWQWPFTGGASGVMRPISGVEVVLIALFIPAIVLGLSRRIRRFRPEEWMLVTFIGLVAVGEGLMVTNAGTLFRLRLQFLFPSLIIASSALPAFAYRFFEMVSRRVSG